MFNWYAYLCFTDIIYKAVLFSFLKCVFLSSFLPEKIIWRQTAKSQVVCGTLGAGERWIVLTGHYSHGMTYQVGFECKALSVLIALQSRSSASEWWCLKKTGNISSLLLGLITGRWRKREQSSTVQELSSFCIASKTRVAWKYRREHSGNQWARRR